MVVFKVRVDAQGAKTLQQLGKDASQLELRFGKTASLIGKAFSGVAIYSGISNLIQGIGNVNEEIDKFHLSLKKIQVVGGISSANINILSGEIRKLAVDTEFMHSQISDAGLVLARMGYESSEAIGKVLPNAMNLATVAGEDLFYTTQGLAQIMNVFGISQDGATDTTNKIGVALNATALDLKGYIEAMQYSAPIARSLGMSFEDTTAMIAYMSQVSIQGSRAGTTLRNAIGGLAEPTKMVTDVMAKYNLQGNDLVGILGAMNKEGAGLTDFTKAWGKWALSGTLAMGQNNEAVVKLLDTIRGGTADVQAQADVIRQESIPLGKQLWNVMTEIGIAIGDAFGIKKSDIIRKFKEQLLKSVDFVKANKREFEQVGQAILKLSEIASKVLGGGLILVLNSLKEIAFLIGVAFGAKALSMLGAYIGGVYKMRTAWVDAGTGVRGFGLAVSASMGPISIAIAAVTTLVTLYDTWKKYKQEQAASAAGRLETAYGTPKFRKDLEDLRESIIAVIKLEEEYPSKNVRLGLNEYKDKVKEYEKLFGYIKEMYGLTFNKDMLFKLNDLISLQPIPVKDGTLVFNEIEVKVGSNTKVKLNEENWKNVLNAGIFKELNARYEHRLSKEEVEKLSKAMPGMYTTDGKLNENYMKDTGKHIKNLDMFDLNTLSGGRKVSGSSFKDIYFGDLSEGNGVNEVNETFDAINKAIKSGSEEGKKTSREFWYGFPYVDKDAGKEKDKEWKAFIKEFKKEQRAWQATGDMANSVYDIFYLLEEKKHELVMRNLDKEQSALDRKYNKEIAAAGDNTFKKLMLEQKYALKHEELQKKMEAEKDAQARAAKRRAIFQATIDTALIILSAMKDMKGGPLERMIGGLTIGAAIAGYTGTIISASYRSGSKGLINGPGNGTSDSLIARVSKGERLLSVEELKRLGGNERVQTLIDRGSVTNNSSRDVHLHIGTFVGNRQYIREVKNALREELTR